MSGLALSQYSSLKPRSVEQITKAAQEYEYNAQVPLRYWLRSAAALLKEVCLQRAFGAVVLTGTQADIYMREGDDETTYLLLFRHAHLILANLAAHPDAKDKTLQPLLLQAKREVDQNLKALDILKPKISLKYERHLKTSREKELRREAQLRRSSGDSTDEDNANTIAKSHVQQLHGHEHRDLAVRLAQQEYLRRAGVHERSSRSSQPDGRDADDLSQRLQAIRSRVDPGQSVRNNDVRSVAVVDGASTTYHYPQVKSQGHTQSEVSTLPASHFSTSRLQQQTPPSLPPKATSTGPTVLPPRPDKVHGDTAQPPQLPTKLSSEPTYTFKPTAFLENGNPLRTLFLPPTLRTTFLRIAHSNTKANLETCGFLAGTLISNALFVSKLIIPAQVSTSDTCEMTNESQLFDFVDSGADLMILGWIHTHPTQTCFMSSRDLHTHAGYQMMLPESIAIVCAPSKGDTTHGGDWGVYRLTDPPGKMAILNCTKPGIFHPHEVDNIYTDALRPGHVVEAQGLEFEVVDLRNS